MILFLEPGVPRQQLRDKSNMRWLIGFVCLIQFFRIGEGGEF